MEASGGPPQDTVQGKAGEDCTKAEGQEPRPAPHLGQDCLTHDLGTYLSSGPHGSSGYIQ